jgi:ATP-binding cassette subfamily B protein
MLAIDRIPLWARRSLLSHGVAEETWQLYARFDRDGEQRTVDGGLLIAEGQLYILQTADREVGAADGREGRTVPKTAGCSLVVLSLQSGQSFVLEELLSSGRLLLENAEGERRCVAVFSNFCKASMLAFVKHANRCLQGETLSADEEAVEKNRCPVCGLPYADPERRICPHCMKRGRLLRRVARFAAKYRVAVLLMVLSLVVLSLAGILVPYFSSGFYYDEVIATTGKFAGNLLLVLYLVVGARVFSMLATMLNDFVTSVIAARMVFDLKKTIFASIQRLSLRFFTGRQTGRLMTQINEDSTTIYEFFCDVVPYLIVHSAQAVLLIVLLFVIEPILALLSLVVCTVYVLLLAGWIFRSGRKLSARRFSASGRLNSFLADVFSGTRVVKAFAKEKTEESRFSERNHRLAQSERRHLLFNNDSWPVVHLLLAAGTSAVWGIGGAMVIRGERDLTYGMLLTFVTYLGMLYSSLRTFAEKVGGTAECANAVGRLFEIMDAQPEITEAENAVNGALPDGSVSLDKVSFSYRKGRRVLENVSFSVPDGGVLGIVGHTGAGKSTLANLLMRLYDADEGEIRIGGIPIKELSLATLHQSVAMVSQETYLFIGTVAENIAYARPSATREEIIRAARCAGAHDFIMALPDGYETRIGIGYQELSGGERQRLSIARAILKNPKILILDEATSAMDTETERRIQAALSALMQGRTTLMIAHRLSTLRDADTLIVIEDGRIVERGTHEALLASGDGVYHRLYTLQMEALRNAGICE